MFSFTEALKDGESKSPTTPPEDHAPRSSAFLPEMGQTPVSPNSTLSTRAQSPGLEAMRSDDETLKEAASPYSNAPEKEFYELPPPKHPSPPASHQAERDEHHRKRRKWSWIIAAIVLLALIAVALGVGLGVGLKDKKGSSTRVKSTLSTVGAFNGSGIALASQSFDTTAFGSIVLYFQHHSGQIRSAQLNGAGDWKGGDVTEVVAVDAKNATPISAVAYARNGTATWHIFYINKQNTISEVINSNKTNVWSPGPINKLNLKAMDDPFVGLQACWYGSFYSDVAYSHSPVPGQSPGPVKNSEQTIGIHLWYGSNPTTFNSVSWIHGDTAWTEQQQFKDYNGHAGVACYSWGPGSNTYAIFVDLQDNINILWKDLNMSHKVTPEHPVHEWVKSDVRIPVFSNTSLGYTNFLYYQNPDLTFSGVNISWDAEHTALPPANDNSQHFVISTGDRQAETRGLPGSHLTLTALPDKSGGDSLMVFYQTNGSDISLFVRDFNAGQWTGSRVPIPDQ